GKPFHPFRKSATIILRCTLPEDGRDGLFPSRPVISFLRCAFFCIYAFLSALAFCFTARRGLPVPRSRATSSPCPLGVYYVRPVKSSGIYCCSTQWFGKSCA